MFTIQSNKPNPLASPLAPRRVTVNDAEMLLAPPPPLHGRARFPFDQKFEDVEAEQKSRAALREYAEKYAAPDDHPLRTLPSRRSDVPAFLTGAVENIPPQGVDAEGARAFADAWLEQELLANALCGVDWQNARERLEPTDVVFHPEPAQEPLKEGPRRLHVNYQQVHNGFPVYGAQMIVHLREENRRAAISSSYIPLRADAKFSVPKELEAAVARAREAALRAVFGVGYQAPNPEAIGLYVKLLESAVQFQLRFDKWNPTLQRAARHLVEALSKAPDELEFDRDALKAWTQSVELRAQQLAFLALYKSLRETAWRATIAPYANRPLFIFPFAGSYYLAFQVQLNSAADDVGWRVFVEADTGTVLGLPENVVHQANIPLIAGGIAQLLTVNQLQELGQPSPAGSVPMLPAISDYVKWQEYHVNRPQGASIELAPANVNDLVNAAGKKLEVLSVAFHARAFLDYFVRTCGADVNLLALGTNEAAIGIAVGKPGPGLDMGFNPQSDEPKLIVFQTDPGGGLQSDHPVHKPSFDPEVITHEFCHALMWRLNKKPFEMQRTSVPFGRALLEGYANYFARSFAARGDSDAGNGERWARGAYLDWGARWSLLHNTGLLPAPNLYPDSSTTGLPVYDVGMVWARALWDIRVALNDPNLVDWAALNAFNAVVGYVASFEGAAEGFIDSLPSDKRMTAILCFEARGILARRGVQAVALSPDGTIRLVATDSGIKHFDAASGTWLDSGALQGGGVLQDAVALAMDPNQNMSYAATEKAIYRRVMNDLAGNWEPAGAWTDPETPLCLVCTDGRLFAGTNRGVYVNNAPHGNGAWARWEGVQALENLVLVLAAGSFAVGNLNFTAIMVANMSVPTRRVQGEAWTSLSGFTPNGLATAITADVARNRIYAGTLGHGIWAHALDDARGPWCQDASNAIGAVMDLAMGPGGVVYAATTLGLFERGAPWAQVAGAPTGIVTRMCASMNANVLLVGTAAQGLWMRVNGAWQQFVLIGV